MSWMLNCALRIAALRGDDGRLSQDAISLEALSKKLAGKSVALVGNARALSQGNLGAQIDAAEVVMRINRAPIPSAKSHGSRTDFLALATSLSKSEFARLDPDWLIWMSHKRKRLKPWMVRLPKFSLFEPERYERLHGVLDGQPTTGALLIDFLADSDVSSVDLFGFDFFSSLSLSGNRSAAQVPHDFDAEEKFVRALVKRDPRITLHPLK